MSTWTDLRNQAEILGCTHESRGINWTWFSFNDGNSAKKFVEYLDSNGIEHRGVYAPDKCRDSWDVRCR